MAETRPGSRAHTYVTLIREGAEELGRGLEVAEIREAYEEGTGRPAPASLTSEISSLKRRGVLEAVGGRPGHTLYAPPDLELDRSYRADDETRIVFEALQRGWKRLGRALSTREVAEAVARGERELESDHPDAVRKRLETLAQRTERGPAGSQTPQVVRLRATSAIGEPSNHWLPADAQAGEKPVYELVAPRSGADALRQAVQGAVEVLGRPVSRTELRWWLESPTAPEPIVEALDVGELGRRLSDTSTHDAEHTGEDGRLHAVTTRFTCHGGAPVRWTAAPPTKRQEALCRLEDTAVAFRVPDEIESIQGLERRAELMQEEGLLRLARIRRHVLASGLRSAAAPFDGKDLVRSLEAIGRTLRRWVEEAPALTDGQLEDRQLQLDERARHLAPLGGVMTFMRVEEVPSVQTVGEAGTASLNELAPLLDHAAELLGLAPHRAQGLIERVRRFPAPDQPGGERFGGADDHPLSHVDRVEAIDAVFELFTVPRARSLIADARRVLGHVVRDADLVRDVLSELDQRRGFPREALLVALGTLGHAVEVNGSRKRDCGAPPGRAWLLGYVLSRLRTMAEANASEWQQTLGTPDRAVETGLRRLRTGYLISVIE